MPVILECFHNQCLAGNKIFYVSTSVYIFVCSYAIITCAKVMSLRYYATSTVAMSTVEATGGLQAQ